MCLAVDYYHITTAESNKKFPFARPDQARSPPTNTTTVHIMVAIYSVASLEGKTVANLAESFSGEVASLLSVTAAFKMLVPSGVRTATLKARVMHLIYVQRHLQRLFS